MGCKGLHTWARKQPASCSFSPMTASTKPTLLTPARARSRISCQSIDLIVEIVSETGGKEEFVISVRNVVDTELVRSPVLQP